MRPLDPKASALAFFGSRLRFWRKVRGWSQAELGRQVHVSGALIGKLEKADRRPGTELARELDAVLEAANELVTLERQIDSAMRRSPGPWTGAPRPAAVPTEAAEAAAAAVGWALVPASRGACGPSSGPAGVAASGPPAGTRVIELPDPRSSVEADVEWAPCAFGPDQELLLRIAEIAAACGFGPEAEPGRLGGADVQRLESITALYRSLDYERGGGLLYREVAGFAESATRLLAGCYGEEVGVRLHSAVAAARQLAGWTAFDAGAREAAQGHWRAAELSALAARDPLMIARVGYCQARLNQHWHRPVAALDRLREVRRDVGADLTPAVRAMLMGLEATLWSALGQPGPALSALEDAAEAFGQVVPDDEPVWMAFFGRAELLAQYGKVHRDLGRRNWSHGVDAVEWLTRALAAYGPAEQRSKVFTEALLASALFVSGDPDEAVRIGWQAITHAQELTSRRVIDRVVEVRLDLGRFGSHPEVADFARALGSVRDSVHA
jgi:transcriptional regulator with XRE-family HTH domain